MLLPLSAVGELRDVPAGNVPFQTINGHVKSYKYEKISIINVGDRMAIFQRHDNQARLGEGAVRSVGDHLRESLKRARRGVAIASVVSISMLGLVGYGGVDAGTASGAQPRAVAAATSDPSVTTENGVIMVNGNPFFPILQWEQCSKDVKANESLGVNVFMGLCPTESLSTTVAAMGNHAYSVSPIGSTVMPSSLGFNQPDEADQLRLNPSQMEAPPNIVPPKTVFMTVTSHFASQQAKLAPPYSYTNGYFTKADVIGFDLYPVEEHCNNPSITLKDVFNFQVQLVNMAGGKPTYQWIETGSLAGECIAKHKNYARNFRGGGLDGDCGRRKRNRILHVHLDKGDTELVQRLSGHPERDGAGTNTQIQNYAPVLLSQQIPVKMNETSPVAAGARLSGATCT